MPSRNRNRDIAGNSVASAAAFERELARKGEIMLKFESVLDGMIENEILVEGLSIKTATGGRADYLITVRAFAAGQKVVCFASGETLVDAIGNFNGRYLSGTLKWKADEYAR